MALPDQSADFMVNNMALRWTCGDEAERRAVIREIEDAPDESRERLMGRIYGELTRMQQPAARLAFHQHIVERSLRWMKPDMVESSHGEI